MQLISTSSSDEELLLAIRVHQNIVAFEILVLRYQEKVYGLSFKIIHSREEAEDIAQEVFTKLWESPNDWKPQAKFSTWLYRVTTNRCLNRLRFLKLKSFLPFTSELEEYTASAGTTPESDFIYSEKLQCFQQAFSKLPGRQKAALHLRYWENLSVKEVAEALDITVKSAESLIYRGKKTLSQMSL